MIRLQRIRWEKLDVALPKLTCVDTNVSSTALGFAWRAWRLAGATYIRDIPDLAEYNANPMTAIALFIAGGVLLALMCIAFVRSQFLTSSTPPPPSQSQPTTPRRTDKFVRINV